MLGRYAELKAQLPPGTILFYQVGTFFETFEEDAKTISKELSIRLTSREAAGYTGPSTARRRPGSRSAGAPGDAPPQGTLRRGRRAEAAPDKAQTVHARDHAHPHPRHRDRG